MSNGYFEPEEAREGADHHTRTETYEVSGLADRDSYGNGFGSDIFLHILTTDPEGAARRYATGTIPRLLKKCPDLESEPEALVSVLITHLSVELPYLNNDVLNSFCSHFHGLVPDILRHLNSLKNEEYIHSKKEVLQLAEKDPYILSLIILGSSGGFIAQNYEARNGNGEVILHPKKDVASDDQIAIIAKELNTEGAKKALGRVYSNVKSELRKTFRNSKIENGNLILSTQNSRDFDSDIRKFINAYCIDDETIQLFFEINIITVSVLQNLSAYFSSLESERRLNERIDIHGIKIRFIEILARKYYEIGEQ